MNAQALALMKTLEARDPGQRKSNVGGWHSSDQIHRRPELKPLVKAIANMAIRCAAFMHFDFANYDIALSNMWFNCNGPGAFNKMHVHPGAFFSGVYYLSAKTTAGAIEFYDPVAARTMTPVPATTKTSDNGGSVQFAPEPGVGLIFPAWLQHAVLANESGEDRVSISFNFLHQRKPPKTA